MRTQKFAFPKTAVAVMIAALVAVPVGSMLGLMGPSTHAPIAGDWAHIADVGPRSVDYRYYDFFEVPFGQWWDLRWDFYKEEQIISRTYPTMFFFYSQPVGNIWTYSNMMLDVKGRNMSEINMNTHPQFLPYLGATRGGTAEINWLMQYLTKAEMARYPAQTDAWADGWVISLNGTTTMDKQAAMAVLGVTSDGYEDFSNWWASNVNSIESQYSAWLLNESNKRLDIYNMYEYPLVPLTFELTALKVGDKIVLTYDIVSWGMEALMTRWLHEAFMPTEHYFEGFRMLANIGPEKADVDITTEVAYGIYAYETTIVPDGKTHGNPCWVWRTKHQDYIAPSLKHTKSDFAPYMYSEDPASHQHNFTYYNHAPGSLWYGQKMPHDYAPTAHNLSANETLVIEFPTGPQLFKEQAYYPNGTPILDQGANWPDFNTYLRVLNSTANMTVNYSAPMSSDNPDIRPGSLFIDNVVGRVTFTGPIDLWTWSKYQTNHQFLAGEWDRLEIIPYSIPYVEFTMGQPPESPCADHYVVSAMSSHVIAGETNPFIVSVYDQYDNVLPSYVGTLHFTSTDGAAVLPGDYTFTTTDAGVHVFNNLTFRTSGLQDLMLVDTDNSNITGQAMDINVNAAAVADHFVLSGIPSIVGVNTSQSVTVSVYDQYDRLFIGYSGMMSFGSNRSVDAVLPSAIVIPPGESHVTLPGGVTFMSLGWFLVNASDVVDSTISGEISVRVELEAPHVDHFVVTGETELAPGEYSNLMVEAIDQYGTTFQTYVGTVHFATDAPGGTYSLPADTAFTPADNGVKVFTSGMRFSQVGTYDVNVSDTATTTAYGLLTDIHVAANPNIVYTAYDFFEEPWGEWYWNHKFRWDYYGRDYILSNTTGQYVQLLEDRHRTGNQGIIFAPYRFNMTAANVNTVDVHHPEFMPILGGVGPQPGAEAEMDIRMQYLDHAWWYSYWVGLMPPRIPQPPNYIDNYSDGYLLGTVITVDLNREAAYEWMGMPISDDPITWWASNKAAYENQWNNWISNEGNVRLDIYCGYEDYYYSIELLTNMTVDSDGDILLRIYHISWGYEVLMTRWLDEAQLCTHQPWFEDFDLHASYGNGIANVTFDAVAQYGFHAVKANASAANDGAWVWEPTRIDYWPSWSQAPAIHPSEFDPYAGPSWGCTTTYQSWNSGDPRFGTEIEYDATPHSFDLSEFQTLVVKLPQGSSVPGYLGQGVGPNAIINMSIGDTHDYDALRYEGTANLGYVITNPANPLDTASLYDPVAKTLTIAGPYDFDNPGGRTGGMLYHGAPWIEFNVLSGHTSPPIADAGPNQLVSVGDLVTFDGSASWDDVRIVNYTWEFWYDGTLRRLYGVSQTFVFLTEGVYNVTLTVRDEENQSSSAVVWITVEVEVPEFPVIMVPVTGMLAVFLLAGVSKRRGRPKRGKPPGREAEATAYG